MTLSAKLNLIVLFVFAAGLAVIGTLSHTLLYSNAQNEVVQQAEIMMEAAQAIRKYTVTQIKPLLAEQMKENFLPESVPAFAATQSFLALREKYPDFTYKEAALNPTNPMNRATDWEADVINSFRNSPDLPQIVGQRETPTGKSLYLAKPILVKDEACLTCHNTFRDAPRPMLQKYGIDNGFGWHLKEIIGAQIVSIPISLPMARAEQAWIKIMLSMTAVFTVVLLILNWFISRIVIRRVKSMSQLADKVSSGQFDVPEFDESGKDELSGLASSFTRLRRSIENAMKMLDSE
jgi:HAMP domain-containing protein